MNYRFKLPLRLTIQYEQGVTFPALYYLLRQYVPEESRSRSIALVSIGTLLGAIISFLVSPFLIERYSWESVFLFFGGVCGPVFVWIWFLLVPNDAATYTIVDDNPTISVQGEQVSYFTMIRNPLIATICFCHFAHNLSHFALMSWLPSFLNDKLELKGDSLAISSLPWLAQGISVWVSSTVADKLISNGWEQSKVRRVFAVSSFFIAGTSMSSVAYLSTSSTPQSVPILVFLSLALAANGSVTAAGYESAKLDLSKTAAAASRLQSLSNTIASLAGVFGVPLVSILKGNENRWSNAFLCLALFFYLAGIAFQIYGRWTTPIL